ncbi:LPS export ABC transporter permease LptG [Prosthecomicrobium hirschii]|uniref:LPS export ABC transporter permease LptG n=2 Tax=Prosthecodimorpha hirschii TaxID=665126 RepID=UPI00221E55E2|nr:LPS export ABC transporter permease LptG [Prosthecomicrobium hirschii]MCW1840197.1 LPS export ABC transporter permease LptG [Prosthecomicrobium hirschii]
MIGRTLATYFASRFVRAILIVFGFSCAIIWLFDFLELFRRTADAKAFSAGGIALISLFRVPSIAEQVLPFATLFGAIAAFLGLSRNLELVVARAAGISVWQFIAPALVVAVTLGAIGTTLWNPIAAGLKDRAEEQLYELTGRDKRLNPIASTSDVWLRQDGPNGESVIRARQSLDQGARLGDVTVMSFDRQGRFRARIDAREAVFADGAWVLSQALVRSEDQAPAEHATYTIPTYLTIEQIRESLSTPETISFWALRSYVEIARNAGLPAYGYELQYQMLMARPLLLAAMVLIAATVSLGVFRFGNVGRLILGGVSAGFVLYVVVEVARDLGGVGIVNPALAAWTPAVIGSLMGFTILLYREDG